MTDRTWTMLVIMGAVALIVMAGVAA